MPLKLTRRRGTGALQIAGTVEGQRVRGPEMVSQHDIAARCRAMMKAGLLVLLLSDAEAGSWHYSTTAKGLALVSGAGVRGLH